MFLIPDEVTRGIEDYRRALGEYLDGRIPKAPAEKEELSEVGINSPFVDEPADNDERYRYFLTYNVKEQKQKGYMIVKVRIPGGDLSADQAEALAGLEEDFTGVEFRTTQNQNICICHIKRDELRRLFNSLDKIFDYFLFPETVLDTVACKGALTCNLGLCNSPGLARAIEGELSQAELTGKEVFDGLDIKINGCPNSCGQHPVGSIALHGVVRRVERKPVPFYKIFLGGRKRGENSRLAEEVGVIPARSVPLFIKDFLNKLESAASEEPPTVGVDQILREKGRVIALDILNDYSHVPPYREAPEYYRDWCSMEDFSLEGVSKGECGAGIIDMIESDLTEAEIALKEAEKEGFNAILIRRSVFLAQRALLVVRGCDPETEEEAFRIFRKEFFDSGIADPLYSWLEDHLNEIGEKIPHDIREEAFSLGKAFLIHIKRLYKQMDSSFNFRRRMKTGKGLERKNQSSRMLQDKRGEDESVKSTEIQSRTNKKAFEQPRLLDLKGTPCPLNYAKAKVFIETLNPGDLLEILLDDGEPIRNVPRSLENDGYNILRKEKRGKYYSLLIKV